jgi:hypothetical protein
LTRALDALSDFQESDGAGKGSGIGGQEGRVRPIKKKRQFLAKPAAVGIVFQKAPIGVPRLSRLRCAIDDCRVRPGKDLQLSLRREAPRSRHDRLDDWEMGRKPLRSLKAGPKPARSPSLGGASERGS